MQLTLLHQVLTARSIIEAALRPLECLTVTPHSHVAEWPNWPIVIWYGEELTL